MTRDETLPTDWTHGIRVTDVSIANRRHYTVEVEARPGVASPGYGIGFGLTTRDGEVVGLNNQGGLLPEPGQTRVYHLQTWPGKDEPDRLHVNPNVVMSTFVDIDRLTVTLDARPDEDTDSITVATVDELAEYDLPSEVVESARFWLEQPADDYTVTLGRTANGGWRVTDIDW